MLNSVFGLAALAYAPVCVPESLAALPMRRGGFWSVEEVVEILEQPTRKRRVDKGFPIASKHFIGPRLPGYRLRWQQLSYIASNSEGVAESWNKPEIRERRLIRDAVFVEGHGQFKSAVAAFDALELPRQKVVRFRLKLKAALSATFEFEGREYAFRIVQA